MKNEKPDNQTVTNMKKNKLLIIRLLQNNRMWGKVGKSGEKNTGKVGEWGKVVGGGTGRTVHRLEFLTKISKNK